MMIIVMALPVLGLALFYFFPFWTVLPFYICVLLISGIIYYGMFTVMGKKKRVRTGFEEMVDKEALVLEDIDPEGKVQIDSEIWDATGRGRRFRKGERVRVCGYEGLMLVVEPLRIS
jgi:membrane protein implicated in regulation of membrane protease activity